MLHIIRPSGAAPELPRSRALREGEIKRRKAQAIVRTRCGVQSVEAVPLDVARNLGDGICGACKQAVRTETE